MNNTKVNGKTGIYSRTKISKKNNEIYSCIFRLENSTKDISYDVYNLL